MRNPAADGSCCGVLKAGGPYAGNKPIILWQPNFRLRTGRPVDRI